MKKVLFLVLFLFIGTIVAFSQNITTSEIKDVVLFTNQALVSRTAEIKVEEGLNEIGVAIEAFIVDKDSVQAKVYGDGEVYSVQFKEVPLEDSPQENIRVLLEEIQELRDKEKTLKNQKVTLNKKKGFLNSFINFAQVQVPEEIKTSLPKSEDLNRTFSFLSEGYSGIHKGEEALAKSMRELNKTINVAKRKLSALDGAASKGRKIIEILFKANKPQTVKIEATYLVCRASWNPFYKINVPMELKDINLTMFSQLRQKSGEDWDNITLAVSNVTPTKGGVLPSLESWILDISRRAYRQKGRDLIYDMALPAASRMVGEGVDYEKALTEAPQQEEAKVIYAQTTKLPLSFEYKLPQKLTIQSQDKETILPIFSKTLKGNFFHYAAPQVSSLTSLACRITPDKELLAGALNVYFAGRFIGKTQIPEKKAGEFFDINLGVDRDVKVEKKEIRDKIDETFFKKIQRQTVIRDMVFKITAENLKSETITLKIIDVIPVSRTDRIEVKDVKINPKPTKENHNDVEGLNLWKLRLAPGQKKEITIEFIITYPKGEHISGL
ncbi:MAG: DUF4139 domain-containing protein [Candidatus Omnitrophica bacterium]|nr:DUF4139 domain-containing protein [Candidatus Omnitrophota bacterium]